MDKVIFLLLDVVELVGPAGLRIYEYLARWADRSAITRAIVPFGGKILEIQPYNGSDRWGSKEFYQVLYRDDENVTHMARFSVSGLKEAVRLWDEIVDTPHGRR